MESQFTSERMMHLAQVCQEQKLPLTVQRRAVFEAILGRDITRSLAWAWWPGSVIPARQRVSIPRRISITIWSVCTARRSSTLKTSD